MKFVALVKCVPDTETKIKLKPDNSGIDEAGIKWVMNPFDEFAVEQALRLKETVAGSTVTVISLGPDRVVEVLRTALAMGADDAVHLKDTAFEGGDSQGDARALAKAIEHLGGADLVFCGKQGIDYDRGQTGPAVAEYLGIAQVLIAVGFELSGDARSATVRRRVEGGDEMVSVKCPALISCEKGLNEPRYASLPNIMKAKKKEIKVLTAADIDVDTSSVGGADRTGRVARYHPLPDRPPVKMIQGDAAAQARDLVKLLREEAKVI